MWSTKQTPPTSIKVPLNPNQIWPRTAKFCLLLDYWPYIGSDMIHNISRVVPTKYRLFEFSTSVENYGPFNVSDMLDLTKNATFATD